MCATIVSEIVKCDRGWVSTQSRLSSRDRGQLKKETWFHIANVFEFSLAMLGTAGTSIDKILELDPEEANAVLPDPTRDNMLEAVANVTGIRQSKMLFEIAAFLRWMRLSSFSPLMSRKGSVVRDTAGRYVVAGQVLYAGVLLRCAVARADSQSDWARDMVNAGEHACQLRSNDGGYSVGGRDLVILFPRDRRECSEGTIHFQLDSRLVELLNNCLTASGYL